ncbi:MAG: creatininase family protein [Cyanobacteria bacterium]|nr:creatininase family protein [Cyanobacteriota bacterium]
MKKTVLIAASFVLLTGTFAVAQQPGAPAAAGQQPRQRREPDPRDMGGGQCAQNPYNCVDAPNPLPATHSVWLEEMTWMDVRDALKAGKTSIIISTGGIEPNGPWLVTGKHNYVLHANCEAIARKMGNALCAPIVKYVPEGDIEKKTSHMASPGTISMREDTFRAVLRDTAESLQAHGFKNIIFIGDSGGNQAGQKAIAEELTAKWAGKALALHIPEYYEYNKVAEYMKTRGIVDGKSDNMHDDPIITLNMFIDDPNSVRFNERVKAGKATINGVNVADKAKNTALAKQIVEFRASQTVDAINKAIAAKKSATSSPQ